jgi:hypothetical protein
LKRNELSRCREIVNKGILEGILGKVLSNVDSWHVGREVAMDIDVVGFVAPFVGWFGLVSSAFGSFIFEIADYIYE